jgi:hypothetical protein
VVKLYTIGVITQDGGCLVKFGFPCPNPFSIIWTTQARQIQKQFKSVSNLPEVLIGLVP